VVNNYKNNSMDSSGNVFIFRRESEENARNAKEENEATDVVNPHYIIYS
jgi:hypothetical protein